jgi:predicted nucleotidyltransferase
MTEKNLSLSDEFLAKLIVELDSETVRAIILHGSYARGNALPLYSDVDLVRIVQESPAHLEQKRFIYRDGYLLSISSKPLSVYQRQFTQPEKAIFVVPSVREARILLDKDEGFRTLQQEACAWTWEPLQAAAGAYVSQLMVEQTEIVFKALRALILHDLVALADMMLDLFSAATEAIAVHRGVLVRSGNTYFHQVQEAAGQQSTWTYHHLRAAGITSQAALSAEERGKETLYLYQETAQLLKPSITFEHWETIAQTIQTLKDVLSLKEIS